MHKVPVSQDDLQLNGGFHREVSRLYMRAATPPRISASLCGYSFHHQFTAETQRNAEIRGVERLP